MAWSRRLFVMQNSLVEIGMAMIVCTLVLAPLIIWTAFVAVRTTLPHMCEHRSHPSAKRAPR